MTALVPLVVIEASPAVMEATVPLELTDAHVPGEPAVVQTQISPDWSMM